MDGDHITFIDGKPWWPESYVKRLSTDCLWFGMGCGLLLGALLGLALANRWWN